MSDERKNTQRTKPSLSLDVQTIPAYDSPPPPPPPLLPPPALKPILTDSSGSNSGWSANYNSSPSTNINYRKEIERSFPESEETSPNPFNSVQLQQQTDPQKILHGRTQNNSPISITDSPPFVWRANHRRRESSLSITSEYALSALPSPSVSAMNIWGFPPGGQEAGHSQDCPGPNMFRRRSCEPFSGDDAGDSYTKHPGTPENPLSRFSSNLANGHSRATSISSPSISSGLARADVISGSGRRFSWDDAPSAKTIDNQTEPSHDDPSLVAGTTTLTLASSTEPSFQSTASDFSNAQNVMLLPSVAVPSDNPYTDVRDHHGEVQRSNLSVSNAPIYAHDSFTSPPKNFPLMRRSSGSLPSPRPLPALLPMEGLNRRSSERCPPPSSERRQSEAANQVQTKHVPCLNHERPHHLATPPSTRNAAFPSRVGPYSILRCLGSGSFSKVYLAYHDAPLTEVVPLTSLSTPNMPASFAADALSRLRRSRHKDDLFAIKAIPRASILEDVRLKASVDRETHLLEYASDHPGVVRFVDALSIGMDGSLLGPPRTTRRNDQGDRENADDWNDSPEPPSSLPAENLKATLESSHSHIDGWECLVLEYVQGGELFDWIMRRFTGIPKSKEKKIEAEAEMNRARDKSRDEEERWEKNREGEESKSLSADLQKAGEEKEEEVEVEEWKQQIWDHERDVKEVFRQLMEVVRYLHARNIVHRDLKLENILITANLSHIPSSSSRSGSENVPHHKYPPLIKLTDFGLARRIDPSSPFLTTRCGSEEYAAPEIISGQAYDARLTDAWAMGVILYACLTGGLPFVKEAGERRRKYLGRIARAEFKWPQGNVRVWQPEGCNSSTSIPHDYRISTEAKLVVEGLLTSSVRSRWTLDKAWESQWMRGG